jgi:hypothetical protein
MFYIEDYTGMLWSKAINNAGAFTKEANWKDYKLSKIYDKVVQLIQNSLTRQHITD